MGVRFGISVSVGDEPGKLKEALRREPEEVFGRPYAGYILFLVSESHRDVLSWLADNYTALDSLTGQYVAFAVFATTYPITVEDVYYDQLVRVRAENRTPGVIGRVPMAKVFGDLPGVAVSRLVRNHEVIHPMRGDEILAVSEGAEIMATAFGVTSDMPCMVVLDANVARSIKVVPIRGGDGAKLMELLRGTMHDVTEDAEFQVLCSHLERLGALESRIDAAKTRIDALNRDITTPTDAEPLLELVADHLADGAYGRLERQVEHRCKAPALFASFFAALSGRVQALSTEARNISMLERYSSRLWPLSGQDRTRYQVAFRTHLRLVADVAEPDADDPSQCRRLLAEARSRQSEIIDSLSELLPTVSTLEAHFRQERTSRLEEARRTLERFEAEAGSLRLKCFGEGHPSFSDLMQRRATAQKVAVHARSVRDFALAVGKGAINVPFLAKLGLGVG